MGCVHNPPGFGPCSACETGMLSTRERVENERRKRRLSHKQRLLDTAARAPFNPNALIEVLTALIEETYKDVR